MSGTFAEGSMKVSDPQAQAEFTHILERALSLVFSRIRRTADLEHVSAQVVMLHRRDDLISKIVNGLSLLVHIALIEVQSPQRPRSPEERWLFGDARRQALGDELIGVFTE